MSRNPCQPSFVLEVCYGHPGRLVYSFTLGNLSCSSYLRSTFYARFPARRTASGLRLQSPSASWALAYSSVTDHVFTSIVYPGSASSAGGSERWKRPPTAYQAGPESGSDWFLAAWGKTYASLSRLAVICQQRRRHVGDVVCLFESAAADFSHTTRHRPRRLRASIAMLLRFAGCPK